MVEVTLFSNNKFQHNLTFNSAPKKRSNTKKKIPKKQFEINTIIDFIHL